jgi:hypothetical protein
LDRSLGQAALKLIAIAPGGQLELFVQRVDAYPAPPRVADSIDANLTEDRQDAPAAKAFLAMEPLGPPRAALQELDGGASVTMPAAVDVSLQQQPQELSAPGLSADFYAAKPQLTRFLRTQPTLQTAELAKREFACR